MTKRDAVARIMRIKAALAKAQTLRGLALELRLAGVWASARTDVAEVWVQDEDQVVRWTLWLGEGGRWQGLDRQGSNWGGILTLVHIMGESARWCPVNVGGGT